MGNALGLDEFLISIFTPINEELTSRFDNLVLYHLSRGI